MAQVEPRFVTYDGDDELAYVLSVNLQRRHLTASQRAMVAVDLLPLLEAQARERQGARTDITEIFPEGSGEAREHAAAAVGVNNRYISDAKRIAEAAPQFVQPIRDGMMTIQDAKREMKEQEREAKRSGNRSVVASVAQVDTLESVFSTIVIDPPWDWGDEGDGDQFGRARPDYATMSIDQIGNLPVARLAAADAHLYLWTTNRSMPKAFTLMERWGFRYITAITWAKTSFGLGNYFRGQTEHILFGVRGSLPLSSMVGVYTPNE